MPRTIAEIEKLQIQAEKEDGHLERADSRVLLDRIRDYKRVIEKHKLDLWGDDFQNFSVADEELYKSLDWK